MVHPSNKLNCFSWTWIIAKIPCQVPNQDLYPLQVAEFPIARPSSSVQPSHSTPTKANDVIEQVLAHDPNTSFSPGQLVIQNPEASGRGDDQDTEPSVIEISPALPDLSLMRVTDPKIMGNPENTVTPPVSQSNSPDLLLFSDVLKMSWAPVGGSWGNRSRTFRRTGAEWDFNSKWISTRTSTRNAAGASYHAARGLCSY